VLKLRCNKRSASTERPTPPLVEEDAPFLKKSTYEAEKKSCSKVSTRPEAKKDCAGEAQQQFNRLIDMAPPPPLLQRRPQYLIYNSLQRQQRSMQTYLVRSEHEQSDCSETLVLFPSFLWIQLFSWVKQFPRIQLCPPGFLVQTARKL
jgi:hypothetical protein